ncbi:uncharacterized protein LOC127986827 isoform X2 [Carassius gibelio]|uniref:uncharacterized protein LOC127986827 isoform X1 n=1 Tax=Carassius gibelio TaxID=101364 RepID=UPI002279BF5D|nr:uncharacterized protein LOC127986827 isoform X1 [Carassius gibelio]XP_052445052.1 uncharacterized protein LOC127986827 isoform X2 [Carassius gibelio]
MMNNIFLFGVLLLVNCVFGVEADEVSVSVMVGDSVTLHTDVTGGPKGSDIIWKFGDEIIARMNAADATPSTVDGPGATFKDRLKLDRETGSLTITDIRTEHIGNYSVDIRGINATLKKFQVTVHDVVKRVPLMEGDSVTLHTGVTQIQGSDQIVWKFGDLGTIITNLNGPDDAKWRNIHLKDQTPDLVISNIPRDQTGVYKVEINTINKVLHRKYHIDVGGGVKTVSVMERDPVNLITGVNKIQGYDLILWKTGARPQSGAPSGIYGAGVGLVVCVVTVFFAARFVDNEIKGVSVKIK